MNMKNIKKVIKESVVQNFMENAKFARRGPSKQRPKSWSKGTKAGSDKRKMREDGKREARGMNEAKDPNEFFGTTPSGETRGLSRNYGVEHEDSPTYYQDQEIARMDHNARWAMSRLLPVYKKHGMDAEHAENTDEYGFPTLGHAITHPKFRAFVQDFIQFHTELNKKHWKQYNRASSYHWPAILRARQGLESLRRHEEYKAKQQQAQQAPNPRSSMEMGWPSREAQRTHAPHELGIPDDIDRYEADLSEEVEELEAELTNEPPHPVDVMLKRIKQMREYQAAQRAQGGSDGAY